MSFYRTVSVAACVAALATTASAITVDFEDADLLGLELNEAQTGTYSEDGLNFTLLQGDFTLTLAGLDNLLVLDSLVAGLPNTEELTTIEITADFGAFDLLAIDVAALTPFPAPGEAAPLNTNIFALQADAANGGVEFGQLATVVGTTDFPTTFNNVTALRLVQQQPGAVALNQVQFAPAAGGGGGGGGGGAGTDGAPVTALQASTDAGAPTPPAPQLAALINTDAGPAAPVPVGSSGGGVPDIAPVPLPAGILFLIGALGMLALMRRTKGTPIPVS